MPFHQIDSLRYFSFDSLDALGVIHAAITRQGGVSSAPWASLNVGGTVGDEAGHVLENRRRSFMALDRSLESMFDVWQVHSDRVVCAEAPRPPDEAHLQADAILTDQPGVTLFMRFADCVPVFLYDPVQRVVGLAHAGWQGTVKHTVARAVEAMVERYSSRPSAIVAGIGPSIAAHHYPVGPEVAQQVRRVFGEQTDRVLQPIVGDGGDSRVQFDLWGANRIILERSGVHQVENSGICSACHLEDWYSHRGEKGRTGRFGAVIALPN